MKLTKESVKKYLAKFDRARVLVVGDLILDEFIWGKADRISPEAPVPVVWAQNRSYMPGGASNVANNIASLGGQVTLVGVVGNDANGRLMTDALRSKKVDCSGVIVDPRRHTTVKTRIIAAHQQVVRVDWENVEKLDAQKMKKMTEVIADKLSAVDAVIIEDYGKGVVTPELLKRTISGAKRRKKIITVDPKVEHFSHYRGVTAMTPNEKEASAGAGIKITCDADVDKVAWTLLKKLKMQGLLVTLGEKGMKLYKGGKITSIPTVAQEVFDVSGAGDTVISVFTLALACGIRMAEAACLSNIAAGIVVGKVGVAVITRDEILEALDRLKGRYSWT